MMDFTSGSGNRGKWEFEYTARTLAEGAKKQKEFRHGRIEFWTTAKAEVMRQIREGGIEVSESIAASVSNYSTKMAGPKVLIRTDFQEKLSECHCKIEQHQQAHDEYDGWIQVLEANGESRLKLTQQDWLYFFGKF